MKFSYLIFIVLLFSLMSCDDNDAPPQGVGQLTIEFDNRVGEENLELNKNYTNSNGETFQLSKLNYYISNIKLTTSDGKVFSIPQDSSYFLVMEDDEESQEVVLKDIPAGDYNQISFIIGVDSVRSTMGITKRQGVLDPDYEQEDMYWTADLGYIFLKMEGVSPVAPADQDHKFYYHIGGYGGHDAPGLNNIREATIDMGNAVAQVRTNKAPEVHLHVDVLEFFRNPSTIAIAEHPSVINGDYSKTVSANYVNMFKYNHVHN
jgi:hypothetical protein